MSTYNVRIYGHQGLARLPVDPGSGGQGGVDSVFVLIQPYLWRQSLVVTAGGTGIASTAASVSGHTSDPSAVLAIEVPDGQVVGIELNPPQRIGGAVAATVDSPRISGTQQRPWGPGWTLSVIDIPLPGA